MNVIFQFVFRTFHYFSGGRAAAAPSNEDDLFVDRDSCMALPILAEEGIDNDKMIGCYGLPQCCVVSPFILPTAPRDARSQVVSVIRPPSARDQLPTVFNDREGVVTSPLGGE